MSSPLRHNIILGGDAMKKKNWVIICSVCVIALFAGIFTYVKVNKNDEQEAEVSGHYIGEGGSEKKKSLILRQISNRVWQSARMAILSGRFLMTS